MKYTQGKWEPCKYGTRPNLKNAVVVWNEDHHTTIAKCVGDNLEANANLIASAPEMLKMLNKCYSGEIEEPYNNDELADLIVRAEGGE